MTDKITISYGCNVIEDIFTYVLNLELLSKLLSLGSSDEFICIYYFINKISIKYTGKNIIID